MTLLTFIGYFLITDAILSLSVVVFFYFFRKDLYFVVRHNLRSLLGITRLEDRLEAVEYEAGLDDGYEPMKPEMKAAIDDIFDIK